MLTQKDPRLLVMMNAPLRTKDAPRTLQSFVSVTPVVGEVLS